GGLSEGGEGAGGPGGSGAGNATAAADGSAASATGATTTTGCGLGGEADGVFLGLRGGTGPQWKGAGHAAAPTEDEVLGILGALTNFGRIGAGQAGPGGGVGPARLQQQMAEMPDQSQDLLRQALASLVAKAPNAKVDESVIVQLAEQDRKS